MKHTIELGDTFRCIKDCITPDGRVIFTKGNIYKSDFDGCLTDDDFNRDTFMSEIPNFFEHFKLI